MMVSCDIPLLRVDKLAEVNLSFHILLRLCELLQVACMPAATLACIIFLALCVRYDCLHIVVKQGSFAQVMV